MRVLRLAFPCLVVLALNSAPVAGCGYDGLINNPFTLAHPGSISLAVTTRTAIEQGTLSAVLPVKGQFGLQRSMLWLEKLSTNLKAGLEQKEVSILIVNSGLWSVLTLSPQGNTLRCHVDKGGSEANIILISEEALSALVNGKLDAASAIGQQLLLIENDTDRKIEKLLLRSFPT